jgi:hypothetical protein
MRVALSELEDQTDKMRSRWNLFLIRACIMGSKDSTDFSSFYRFSQYFGRAISRLSWVE